MEQISSTSNPLMVLFEEYLKEKYSSHIIDLITITIKSLVPSEDYSRINIDYKRFGEEIKLWKYYRNGENKALMNVIEQLNPNVYWSCKDDSVYPRIIPIVLSNRDFSVIKEEVIKNILFTTGHIETLIEGLLLSKILFYKNLDINSIIPKLKEEIISLSSADILNKFKDNFRVPIEVYDGNYFIDFERNKISGLNTLNLSFSNKFKVLEEVIKALLGRGDETHIIAKCVRGCDKDKSYELDEYYINLSNYVYKLRNGQINRDSLIIDKYYLPDVFQYEEGDEFYHSLLKKAIVLKKYETEYNLVSHIKAKSGTYIFKNSKNLP